MQKQWTIWSIIAIAVSLALPVPVRSVSAQVGTPPIGAGTQVWIGGQCSGGSGPIATPAEVAADVTWLGDTLVSFLQRMAEVLYQGQANISKTIQETANAQYKNLVSANTQLATNQAIVRAAETYQTPASNSAACTFAGAAQAFSDTSAVNRLLTAAGASIASNPPSAANIPAVLSSLPGISGAASRYNLGTATSSGTAISNLSSDAASTPCSFDASSLETDCAKMAAVSPDDPTPPADPDAAEKYILHVTNPFPDPMAPSALATGAGKVYNALRMLKEARLSLAQRAMTDALDMNVGNPSLTPWVQSLVTLGVIPATSVPSDLSTGISENQLYKLLNDSTFGSKAWYQELTSSSGPAVERQAAQLLALNNQIQYRRLLLEEDLVKIEAADYALYVTARGSTGYSGAAAAPYAAPGS